MCMRATLMEKMQMRPNRIQMLRKTSLLQQLPRHLIRKIQHNKMMLKQELIEIRHERVRDNMKGVVSTYLQC